jgi:hypothetical protein
MMPTVGITPRGAEGEGRQGGGMLEGFQVRGVLCARRGGHCQQGPPRVSRHTREGRGELGRLCVAGTMWHSRTDHAARGIRVGPEPRIPGAERGFPRAVQHACVHLQQEMGPTFAPWHLLFFHHALSDHLVHGRFDKASADALSVAVPLAIVGDKAGIVRDIVWNSPTPW